VIDDLEGDIGERETESDRRIREFRQLDAAKVAIEQRLQHVPEKSAYDAWCRLIAKPNLVLVAQAQGDSNMTLRSWLAECCDIVADEVPDGRVSANAIRRLHSTFIEVAHLFGWML
jgi:hypothetical protein